MHTETGRSLTAFTVDGGVFRDASGRQVVFRGLNVSGNEMKGPLVSRDDLARIRDWGYNAIRYVMAWSAIEPECGRYDESEFARIADRLAWAKEFGIAVLLDMHQDLWSKAPGAGMPAWTVVDDAQEHISDGPNWSAAYFQSPWVQTAFDHFWHNTPGPDGVGIQERFAFAWREVAARFSSAPNLIGYDLLNEPFPGSALMPGLAAATESVLPHLDPSVLDGVSEYELGMIAYDATNRSPEIFDAWLAGARPVSDALDRDLLRPMQARITAAIREVDQTTPICLEPFLTANAGVIPSQLRWDGEHGDDPNLVFAPHIYEADPAKAARSTEAMLAVAKTERMPLLIGEWGNLDNSDGMYLDHDPFAATRAMLTRLENAGASTMYWVYHPGLERDGFFGEFLQRPAVRAISGALDRCVVGEADFTCTWIEDPNIDGPSELVVPANSTDIEIDGAEWRLEPIAPTSPHALLVIPPTGETTRRTLRVQLPS